MTGRTWIPVALALIGLTLIVAGGMTFSRGGWGTMGPGYSGMCDSDEFYGAHVIDEPLSRGGATPVFGPGANWLSSGGMVDGAWVYTLDEMFPETMTGGNDGYERSFGR